MRPVQITRETEQTVSDDNFKRFTNCAVEVLSVDASQVTREASFADDLDADSLDLVELVMACLLYTSPSPRDRTRSRMPSSA